MMVTDVFGFAVSGAQVKMTLANGTVLSGATKRDCTFYAPAIPSGTFTASISSRGSTSQLTGDAPKQSVTPASVLFGTTSLAIVVALVVVVAVVALFALRKTRGGRQS